MRQTFVTQRWFCRAAALCLILLPSSTILRQQTSGGSPVAVVDLTKVFEAHGVFKTNMESVQKQIKSADHDLQTKKQELSSRNSELSQLNPMSSQYRQLESQIAQQAADLNVQARQAKKEFMQKEAAQYHAAYQEIIGAVQRVAEKYDIRLVLRYDASEIDPQNPQSVAMGMSRSVLVQRNLDITPYVIQKLQTSLAQKSNQVPVPRR